MRRLRSYRRAPRVANPRCRRMRCLSRGCDGSASSAAPAMLGRQPNERAPPINDAATAQHVNRRTRLGVRAETSPRAQRETIRCVADVAPRDARTRRGRSLFARHRAARRARQVRAVTWHVGTATPRATRDRLHAVWRRRGFGRVGDSVEHGRGMARRSRRVQHVRAAVRLTPSGDRPMWALP